MVLLVNEFYRLVQKDRFLRKELDDRITSQMEPVQRQALRNILAKYFPHLVYDPGYNTMIYLDTSLVDACEQIESLLTMRLDFRKTYVICPYKSCLACQRGPS